MMNRPFCTKHNALRFLIATGGSLSRKDFLFVYLFFSRGYEVEIVVYLYNIISQGHPTSAGFLNFSRGRKSRLVNGSLVSISSRQTLMRIILWENEL
jgi:hypothetical protein